MPRKPAPPVRVGMDRAQKMATAAPAALDGTRLTGAREVPLDQVVPDPGQPRLDWDHDDGDRRLNELAASIREFGILQPLLVREEGTLNDGRTRYLIIAGGRRREAAARAGLAAVPVVVRGDDGDRVRVLQLLENIQRQDLAPLDEARAYHELMAADGISAEALGARLHVSGQQVRMRLRLLGDQVLADAVERGQIVPSVARAVQQLPDAPREILRARVAAGEALGLDEVQAAQARSAAAGTRNPRAKGGGRARPVSPDQTLFDNPGPVAPAARPPATTPDQTVFDNAPSRDRSGVDPAASVASTLRALADKVEAEDLEIYIKRQQARDARYSPAADYYVVGFVSALKALRRRIEA